MNHPKIYELNLQDEDIKVILQSDFKKWIQNLRRYVEMKQYAAVRMSNDDSRKLCFDMIDELLEKLKEQR